MLPALANSIGLPKVLLEYQSKAVGLLDSSAIRVLFIEKSRRIGLTWGLAAYAALRAGRQKKAGGMDVMYISYSQDMTREFIDAVAMWAKAFAMAAFDMEEYLFEDTDASDPSHTRQIKAFRIRFASGFEVMGLSSAPRSLRGGARACDVPRLRGRGVRPRRGGGDPRRVAGRIDTGPRDRKSVV